MTTSQGNFGRILIEGLEGFLWDRNLELSLSRLDKKPMSNRQWFQHSLGVSDRGCPLRVEKGSCKTNQMGACCFWLHLNGCFSNSYQVHHVDFPPSKKGSRLNPPHMRNFSVAPRIRQTWFAFRDLYSPLPRRLAQTSPNFLVATRTTFPKSDVQELKRQG